MRDNYAKTLNGFQLFQTFINPHLSAPQIDAHNKPTCKPRFTHRPTKYFVDFPIRNKPIDERDAFFFGRVDDRPRAKQKLECRMGSVRRCPYGSTYRTHLAEAEASPQTKHYDVKARVRSNITKSRPKAKLGISRISRSMANSWFRQHCMVLSWFRVFVCWKHARARMLHEGSIRSALQDDERA